MNKIGIRNKGINMNWTGLDNMVEDLELKSNPKDIHGLITEIKTLRVEIHPDHSGESGNFKSKDDEIRYLRLSDALEYCETFETNLIPINAATSLIKNVAENIARTNKESLEVIVKNVVEGLARANKEPVETRITKASTEMITKFQQKYNVPKISLGATSAALIYAFVFPQTIIDHPYLSKIVNNYNFFIIWLNMVILLAALWLIAWMRETKGKSTIRRLLNLGTHRAVLDRLRQSKRFFSRTELRDSLAENIGHDIHRNRLPLLLSDLLFHGDIDMETLDGATELAIERYLERNWIQRIERSDVDDWYDIIIRP